MMCSQSHESHLHLVEDHLSSLPNEILLIILSFLPFKQVVQTSILSRSWLNLWIHSPVLHFHAPSPEVEVPYIPDEECKSYVKWINRVLRRHKCRFLKEFKLVCVPLDKRRQKTIDKWLEVAFAKKVQCLELDFSLPSQSSCFLCGDKYVFPGPFLNRIGKSQYLFDFKCLESLSLKRVKVDGEGINFFLEHCPFLEKLEVVGSDALDILVISDPTLVLKYLTIKHCYRLQVFSISNLNFLVSLDISANGNLTLTGLPMLVELFISGTFGDLSSYILKASACFSKLEALMLDGLYLEDVTQLLNYNGKFKKLKQLVVCFSAIGDESLINLISLVNSCPRLEEFVLMLFWDSPHRIRTPIYKVERTRKSIKSKSLKVFEFRGYFGRFSDVELINAVKKAVRLEKIIIDPRDRRPLIHELCWMPATRNEEQAQEEEDARSVALGQFDSLREIIPPHVHLLIR